MRRAVPVLASLLLAAGCATTPAGRSEFPPRLTALGTEPFWSFTLESGILRYTTPEAPAARSAAVTQHVSPGAIELHGSFAGQPLHAAIRREPCSDGMSDRRYAFAVTLTIERRQLVGCAYDADRPPPPE